MAAKIEIKGEDRSLCTEVKIRRTRGRRWTLYGRNSTANFACNRGPTKFTQDKGNVYILAWIYFWISIKITIQPLVSLFSLLFSLLSETRGKVNNFRENSRRADSCRKFHANLTRGCNVMNIKSLFSFSRFLSISSEIANTRGTRFVPAPAR